MCDRRFKYKASRFGLRVGVGIIFPCDTYDPHRPKISNSLNSPLAL